MQQSTAVWKFVVEDVKNGAGCAVSPSTVTLGFVMVLYHIVLFRLREGAPAQAVADLQNELRALTQPIPFIHHIAVGAHDNQIYDGYKPRNQGYTHALLVTLRSGADLKKYAEHPAHLACVDKIKPLSEAVLAVDFMDYSAENGFASVESPKATSSSWKRFNRRAIPALKPLGFFALGAIVTLTATSFWRLKSLPPAPGNQP